MTMPMTERVAKRNVPIRPIRCLSMRATLEPPADGVNSVRFNA